MMLNFIALQEISPGLQKSLLMLNARQKPPELFKMGYHCLLYEHSAPGLIWVEVSPVYALWT